MTQELKMNTMQQNACADVAQLCSKVAYEASRMLEQNATPSEWRKFYQEMGENLTILLIEKNSHFSSQQWGLIYDKMHRSGANF